jgi:hypothetical protein
MQVKMAVIEDGGHNSTVNIINKIQQNEGHTHISAILCPRYISAPYTYSLIPRHDTAKNLTGFRWREEIELS